MFKVIRSGDRECVGLVDSLEAARKIVIMRKTGRNGREVFAPAQTTASSKQEYSIEECVDSVHPGYR